ncbi:NPP1 family protein [Xanthomonas hortorum pv. hederae]|nr:NPP1 family protein [Xanthomonas hortorum pv. hederae]
MKPTGASNGGCSHSPGQVYVRSGWYRGVWAIMYSWYFPKDSPSSGLGHRHDWESIVVWINNPSVPRPTVYALSYSAHGNYSYLRNPAASLRDNHPKVVYGSTWPTNHEMFIGPYNPVGGMQPLIAWESMDQWVKDALTYTNFGAANVPFIDKNFNQNLGKAWYYN